MIFNKTIKTSTEKEIIDITNDVEKITKSAKIEEGLLTVFTKHTTCPVMLTELSQDLESDILKFFSLGQQLGPYNHDPANPAHAPAHIFSSIIGQSISIPIQKAQAVLGTWQKIVLVELAGPREREIVIQIISA